MLVIRQIPLARFILPFVGGIVLCSYVPVPVDRSLLFAVLAGSGVLLFLLGLWKRWHWHPIPNSVYGVLVNLAFAGAGYSIANLHIGKYHPDHFEQRLEPTAQWTLVRLVDEPQGKENSIKAQVTIEQIRDSAGWHPATGNALLYLQKDSIPSLSYGSRWWVRLRWQPVQGPQNPNEFNYKRYLFHHHIYHQGYCKSTDIESAGPAGGNPVLAFSHRLRNSLLQNLKDNGIQGEAFAVCSALLLGQKEHLSGDLVRAYSRAGAMHVLAVSGLHVGIIYLVINTLLRWMDRSPRLRYPKALFLLLSVWLYALVTGLSPSVIRAATMFSFVTVGNSFHRNTNIYNTLAASAFVILLADPFMLMEVGMQLSYLAVLGIVYLQPKMYRWITFRNPILDKAWAITCVSVAAQLATAPLAMLYFHQFPTYFMISNLLVIPAAFLVLFLGLLLFATSWLPPVAQFVALLLKYCVSGLNWSVKQVERLPHAIVEGIDISVPETWLLYAGLGSLLLWLAYKRAFGLYLCGFFVIVGTVGQIRELHAERTQSFLTFYKVRKHSAAAWITGNTCYWLTDTALLVNEEKTLFHLKHHWWNRGVSQVIPVTPGSADSTDTPHVFRLGTTRIAWLHTAVPEVEPPPLDWVIVSNNQRIPRSWVETDQIHHVVVDASNSYKHARKVTRFLKKHEIPFTDLSRSGGFTAHPQKPGIH